MFPHARRTQMAAVVAVGALLALTACSSSDDSDPEASSDTGKVSGEITVLTNRTDIVDTTFRDYAQSFNQVYPDVKVKFEAIKDYEGEVVTRMNTEDYGDVLLIPFSVNPTDLPNFFEPLGSVDELSPTYRFVKTEATLDGQSYGLAITGNAQGFVYNTKVWSDAGITELPKSTDEFLADLEAIKAKGAAIPLYTNYKDGWPLNQWENLRGTISGDPEAANNLGKIDAPWADGEEHAVWDGLLFDAVKQGLTEADPTTTNWDQSKKDLAEGRIGTMFLGSWAISQMQELAADRADVDYMPFPNQVDGKFQSTVSGDYKNAINVHSKNKAAARAWLLWFADHSGYAHANGGISPRIDGDMPDSLKTFTDLGVELVELAPAEAGKESLVNDIDSQSEIGLNAPDYRQRIIDAARGATDETKQQIFDDLNTRWADARAAVEG